MIFILLYYNFSFTSSIIYALKKPLDASKTSLTFGCEHGVKNNHISLDKISMNSPLEFTIMWHCNNCYSKYFSISHNIL